MRPVSSDFLRQDRKHEAVTAGEETGTTKEKAGEEKTKGARTKKTGLENGRAAVQADFWCVRLLFAVFCRCVILKSSKHEITIYNFRRYCYDTEDRKEEAEVK